MRDKSKLLAIILVIITILVVVLTNIFNKDNKEEKQKIEIVTNYSNFYTVDSCLYRTITYITAGDKKSVLALLSNKYKKENNINSSNVMDLFKSIEEDSIFVSKKMYYEEINSNIIKYYVYGHIEKNQILDDEFTQKREYKESYFIVYLDTTNKTFSVEPYDGDVFIGGEINE